MARVNVHMIADDALMEQLSVATKMTPNPAVIASLKDAGFNAADQFLANHGQDIGKRSSTDLPGMFS